MGLMDRIFHRTKAVAPSAGAWASGEKAFTNAEKIVQDYGAATQAKRSRGGGCIADVQELPHSKERIKEALALLLTVADAPPLREQLKSSYLLLADWQEGVGDGMVGMRPDGEGNDPSAEQSKGPAAQSGAWESWERWRPRVLEEERALKAELQQLGLW